MKYDFTLTKIQPVSDIVSMLNRHGIAHIPDFADSDELKALRQEFERLLTRTEDWIKPLKYAHGRAASITRERMDASVFPNTVRVFDSDFMKSVLNHYFGTPSLLNDDIFITHDKDDPEPINPLHFDRIHSLKFFLYLLDTRREDGAFDFGPGTHYEGFSRRQNHTRRGGRVFTIPNVVHDEENWDTFPIEGAAGTLIIFDTDGFHRGGIVSAGRKRMVMRGHSHHDPVEQYNPAPLTRQWWRESIFNPKRYFG